MALPKFTQRFNTTKRKAFVSKIRSLKNQGAAFELQAMYTLLDFEALPIAWKSSPSVTFADVLKEERLYPVSRWRAFKRAVKTLPKKTIERLGVAASCLIAQQPDKKRFRLVRQAQDFRKKHDVEPTYQYISMFIRGKTPKRDGPTRAQLLKYVEKLKDRIRELKGRIPSMTEG